MESMREEFLQRNIQTINLPFDAVMRMSVPVAKDVRQIQKQAEAYKKLLEMERLEKKIIEQLTTAKQSLLRDVFPEG